MNSNTPIRDKNGNVKGFIQESDDRRIIKTASGNYLGFYHKVQNRTYDVSGNYLGTGDLTMTLLKF